MPKRNVQDIIDPQPSEDELVIQEAPSIEQMTIDAPAPELDQVEPIELPLAAMSEIIWMDQNNQQYKLQACSMRGEYRLAPYYGA